MNAIQKVFVAVGLVAAAGLASGDSSSAADKAGGPAVHMIHRGWGVDWPERRNALEASAFDGVDVVHIIIRVDLGRKERFSPSAEFLTDAVRRIHAAGRVASGFAWTNGDKAEVYAHFAEMGFDCFATDWPEALQKYLAKPPAHRR